MEKSNTAAGVKATKQSLLAEFARWMKEAGYDSETIEKLLYEPWDGAYPESLPSDDVILDIEDFLYAMAMFAVEKAFGEKIGYDGRLHVEVVPCGSYEDWSSVYVLEMRTKTVMAALDEKTWHFNPETIEEGLEDLISQLEKSKVLLAVRSVTDA